MKSPCTGRCQVDFNNLTCRGCNRTTEEIALWTTYSEEEQITIIERIEKEKTKARLEPLQKELLELNPEELALLLNEIQKSLEHI